LPFLFLISFFFVFFQLGTRFLIFTLPAFDLFFFFPSPPSFLTSRDVDHSLLSLPTYPFFSPFTFSLLVIRCFFLVHSRFPYSFFFFFLFFPGYFFFFPFLIYFSYFPFGLRFFLFSPLFGSFFFSFAIVLFYCSFPSLSDPS